MTDALMQNSPAARPGLDRCQPLCDKAALVLDTGRDDGVTEACCLELARLGARIALSFEGADCGCEAAFQIVQNVKEAGGEIVAIEGIPYRYEIYSDGATSDSGFIDNIAHHALAVLEVGVFDLIGKHTTYMVIWGGWFLTHTRNSV